MVAWREVERDAPEFAARVRTVLDGQKHKAMATLRRDGSPRISGTELTFAAGEVFSGSMPGAVKGLDLRRDPRVAVHSMGRDPDEEDPGSWPGDAKFAGRAVLVTDPAEVAAFWAAQDPSAQDPAPQDSSAQDPAARDPAPQDSSAQDSAAQDGGVPGADGSDLFRFDVAEVVLTTVRPPDLVVESWHEGVGYRRRVRK